MQNSLVIFDPKKTVAYKEVTPPNVVEGAPLTKLWQCVIAEDGKIHSGFWSCENGSFTIDSHTSNEMCTILEGEAIVEMGDGTKHNIKAGDTIFIPFGIKNTWHVKNYIRKSYICCIPN